MFERLQVGKIYLKPNPTDRQIELIKKMYPEAKIVKHEDQWIDKLFVKAFSELRNTYGEFELELNYTYCEEETIWYLVYYPHKVGFLDETLLVDLYTQIDNVLIPRGLNVHIFFDSEREYL